MSNLKNISYCPRCLEEIQQHGIDFLDDYFAICEAYNDDCPVWAKIFDNGLMNETFSWLDERGHILTACVAQDWAQVRPNVIRKGFFCCEKGC